MLEKNQKINTTNILLIIIYGLAILSIILFGLYLYKSQYSFYIEVNEISMALGETYQIEIIPEKDKEINYSEYTYKSKNENVATITQEGYIEPSGIGTTEIEIISKKGFSKETLIVNVLENQIETITFMGNITLKKYEIAKCYPIINNDSAIMANLTYYSENENIATVDENGNIKALNHGTTKIFATAKNGVTGSIAVIVENDTIEAESISVEPTKLTLEVGTSNTLKINIIPENTTNKALSFISSNPSIVSVDQNGIVIAKKEGEASIIIKTTNGLSTTSKVTVKESKKNEETVQISLSSSAISLNQGETYQLTATISPDNAENKTLTWISSDTSIATVDNGIVTAKKAGIVTIIAKTITGNTATCKVTVQEKNIEVTSIELSQTTTTLDIGNSITLTAIVLPENATNKSVTWASSDINIVSVSSNGTITAQNTGTATITVKTANGKTKECVVTVPEKSIEATAITLNKITIEMNIGNTETLIANITPSNTTNKNITWTSSDTNIATVDNGKIIAKNAGVVTITAKTANGKTATCKVTVKNPTIYATSISLNATSLSIYAGNTSTLTATITPSNTTNKNVTWTSSDTNIATVDNGKIIAKNAGVVTITAKTANGKTATCKVTVKKNTFTNPLDNAADPWVTQKDGYYYYTATTGKDIKIFKTKNLHEIGLDMNAKTVYNSEFYIWAPEIHYIQNRWYIYFTIPDTSKGTDDGSRRMYVLRSKTQDAQGEYEWMGKIYDSTDMYAIDGTVLQWKGELYFIWSGLENIGGSQNLYIAHMSNPYTIDSERVLISTANYDWEKYGWSINEGPEVLIKNDTLHIIYSASSAANEHYSLGMLTYNGGNILSSASWKKSSNPVFKSANELYGPGHASFVKSPDGTEDWIIYHAYDGKEALSNWSNRKVFIQKFTWNGNTPVFGNPLASNIEIKLPSGIK